MTQIKREPPPDPPVIATDTYGGGDREAVRDLLRNILSPVTDLLESLRWK